jgi:non-specific serine/threonine protein kinase
MLETIREYALERLDASGDADATQRCHAAWFLTLAVDGERGLWSADQSRWVTRLEADLDNLRAALGWAVETGKAETALRVAGPLWVFWLRHGHIVEADGWYQRVLLLPGPASDAARAWALFAAAAFAWGRGDTARARQHLVESESFCRASGDRRLLAWIHQGYVTLFTTLDDVERAAAHAEEGLRLIRPVGQPIEIAQFLIGAGIVAYGWGEHARAEALYREALATHRAHGDVANAAVTLLGMAQIARDAGDLERASAYCLESLALISELRHALHIGDALLGLAAIRAATGDLVTAVRWCGTVQTHYAATGQILSPHGRLDQEKVLATARAGLGESALADALAAGGALSLEAAIAEATMAATAPLASVGDPLAPSLASHGLTRRELDVLRLVAGGRADKEIASALFISPRTAGRHVSAILAKLGVESRAAAAARAVRDGLV